jgi:putative flavoprotein involved in K+ transport
MVEKIETVIIGGGQAGLSLNYYLTRAGREHIILEKSSQVADAWRNRRWDSFTLVTPNWSFKLPGVEYAGPEMEGFLPKAEILRRFEQYEQENHPPILYSTEVTRVEPMDGRSRYRVLTNMKTYESQNVVVATGQLQKVKYPAYASRIAQHIYQIPSDQYRNPQALPPGAILVIGSAQSGGQIAEELNEAGRKVYLSTGAAGRVPRRYRGLDVFDWLFRIGYFERTTAMLNSPKERFVPAPHLSGKAGGHELNLHRFSRDGIILLGHTQGFEDGKVLFAADLKENLAKADGSAAFATNLIDEYIQKKGIDQPEEEVMKLDDGFRAPLIRSLDLAAEGISTIIWATGYLSDYSFVQLPILDADNFPSTERGVTKYPGLYFLGMTWMDKFKTGLFMGVGEAAQYLAEVISGE